jgi:hypothetical protein
VPEVKNFHDYGYEITGIVPGEVPISDIILKSSLASKNGPEQVISFFVVIYMALSNFIFSFFHVVISFYMEIFGSFVFIPSE